ncbi:Pls/PosA family non-ribosomal peptide synthetase [Luteipulveratus halotolerans]|uniref:Amino acid adenylation protein n=1 Tax=Luteipulveratus halotolerans TaxID=1631356 RepID=A0A0L6CMV2_9MICO|nr:Pls/PosA family non-ribosomal peptide synthetase [Luteipulveratus halotolerans]KNX39047.1 amino acid adenylation protein [Luteipulveratus halotolerans]
MPRLSDSTRWSTPVTLLRGTSAPPPRTLVDIFTETVQECPDAPALDNGATVMTYAELHEAATELAEQLAEVGVARGDRVGVRIKSGTTDLYVAIIGTLLAGAAYVPVDADDPDERARTVFGEAAVAAVLGDDLTIDVRRGLDAARPEGLAHSTSEVRAVEEPTLDDDAWIIFTSGSTGTPKGVAVSHRNAAAFVDAEARLFLQDDPLGVDDRVMAGLSVAFDASCEEMWLAWRYGACLVPAPRSLVRSGMDLGPWLIANSITVVSTVPTLLALWPAEALAKVRLLILGGEAAPAELGARYFTGGREAWNTYGPTEATVVACAAPLTGEEPVRIGLPLDGWDLEVVDAQGNPVAEGETGELIIGGVGLARYLDPAKDAEKYAPMPTLGWDRAYRSGDLVVRDSAGLVFGGRADEQIKLGGRRIELGEVDAALTALPGVAGGAAAVRKTSSGTQILVGYVKVEDDFDLSAAMQQLRAVMPATMVPRLAAVDTLPTRTSGKIDRNALPWPVATLRAASTDAPAELTGTPKAIADLWLEVLGAEVTSENDDFFDLGGGSLTAAQMVSRLRETQPEITVADIYDYPTVKSLAAQLDSMSAPANVRERSVRPTPLKTQLGQNVGLVALRWLAGLRWVAWLVLGTALTAQVVDRDLPTATWWAVVPMWLVLLTPPGRMALAVLLIRLTMVGIEPGSYPRGGKVHLRLWLAEHIAEEVGATRLSGAPWMTAYARALGAKIGKNVDLHSFPPVTGFLTVGAAASIEPEVDLSGHWLDGDRLHIGTVTVRREARVGTRSTLTPGAVVGRRAEIAPGSAVFGEVPDDEAWSGAPATKVGKARGPWSDERPKHKPVMTLAYGLVAVVIALLPVIATAAAVLVGAAVLGDRSLAAMAVPMVVAGGVVGLIVLTALIWVSVRLLGIGLTAGHHPVHSRQALQAWGTMRVLDEARTWLFPLYSSALTPAWLRSLGARIGSEVEASTVLMIPSLVTVGEGAFLADDTLVGPYELGGGWLRVERTKIGKRAFVGNSGMTAPGRKVPKKGLVAVLSAAPGKDAKPKSGTSWLGSPPQRLRRQSSKGDDTRTYRPPRRLKVARALVEACRIVPVLLSFGLAVAVAWLLLEIQDRWGLWAVLLLAGLVLMVAGAVAAAVTTLAKWALVGRIRAGDHPLWSSFVWRNELADTFVEVLAAPWLARSAAGSPVLNLWLRTMGSRIGRGVWCETYWLPEADLIELRDGATVSRGCVVQTHLFHDRVLSMDEVVLKQGATIGPHGVILPAATLGRHATVGPVSLVMRGESVPDKTRWIGNPIGPWVEDD